LMMKASKSTSSAAANCCLRSSPARRPTGWPPAVPSARPSPNRRALLLARAVSSGPAYAPRCAADRGPLSSESDELDDGREYLFACGSQRVTQHKVPRQSGLCVHFWPWLLLNCDHKPHGAQTWLPNHRRVDAQFRTSMKTSDSETVNHAVRMPEHADVRAGRCVQRPQTFSLAGPGNSPPAPGAPRRAASQRLSFCAN
jgi:hypothetical protein